MTKTKKPQLVKQTLQPLDLERVTAGSLGGGKSGNDYPTTQTR